MCIFLISTPWQGSGFGSADLETGQQKPRQNFQRTIFNLKITALAQRKCAVIEKTQLRTKFWKYVYILSSWIFLLKCLEFKFECVTICLKHKLSISFYSNLHTSYFAKCFLKLMLSNAQRKQCINLPRTQYFLDVPFSKRPIEKTSGNAVQTAVYF